MSRNDVTHQFCIGDLAVSVSLGADVRSALVGLFEAVFATLPVGNGTGRQVHYHVRREAGRFALRREGEPIYETDDPRSLVDCIELDVYDHWIAGVDEHLLVHAGAVASNRGATLLVGESGAGKSTLTFELVRRGARLLSDEWVLVEPDRRPDMLSDTVRVRGIVRPIALHGALDSVPRGWQRFVREVPTPAGTIDRWTLMHPPPRLRESGWVPLTAAVLLTPSTHEPAAVSRLEPAAALVAFRESVLRGAVHLLHALAPVLDRRDVFRLTSPSAAEAVRLLLAHRVVGPLSRAG